MGVEENRRVIREGIEAERAHDFDTIFGHRDRRRPTDPEASPMIFKLRTLAATLLVTTLFAPALQADVSSLHIVERRPLENGRRFGDAGPYSEIVVRIKFAIDSVDPLNRVIMNLDRAPRNGKGTVLSATCSTRICLRFSIGLLSTGM